jgi:DNA-directed RNA polymerase alpha subunit
MNFSKKTHIFLSNKIENPLFLHCVDSRVEENGSWYSRFHIGPFDRGSRLQIGTRLRRSLLNDLSQTVVIAVKINGAVHEFSRISGIHEPILDLLFQFRKIALNAPFLKLGEVVVVPFLFYGPGIFYSSNISWPNGIKCRNPKTYLGTLAPGAFICGRLLIQKIYPKNVTQNISDLFYIGKTFSFEDKKYKKNIEISFPYPWFRLGFPNSLVKRVGFRIEPLAPLNPQNEILIFEIVTNGRISPRQVLRESRILLAYKFSCISYLLNTFYYTTPNIKSRESSSNEKTPLFYSKGFYQKLRGLGKKNLTFSTLFNVGFSNFREPLNLDLGNLELSKERYCEFQNLGFKTLGQLLERLAFESHTFSPKVKKQRQKSLFYLGMF